jgi:hypothetical protein
MNELLPPIIEFAELEEGVVPEPATDSAHDPIPDAPDDDDELMA